MKSLTEFRILTEESDYAKFDMLVRAGLANKAQLQRIHKILNKMKEDRPVFNNTDRAILQNLFNKMVDLLANNKQIFQKTRQAVREDVELEEKVEDVETADYKIGPSGKKVRAHKFKVGDKVEREDEVEEIQEAKTDELKDPPFVLVLKRKSFRQFPNKTKVALYYNAKLDKYFTIPYGPNITPGALQAEEVEQLQEGVMDQLHNIVNKKAKTNTVKFANGQTRKVDHFTASAITQIHNAVNDDNKKKLADMVHKSPAHLEKAAAFAFSKAKK